MLSSRFNDVSVSRSDISDMVRIGFTKLIEHKMDEDL